MQRLLIYSLLILLGINIFILYRYHSINHKVEYKEDFSEVTNTNYSSIIQNMLINSNFNISEALLANEKRDTISIMKLIEKNGQLLVFYFSDYSCSTCVQDQLRLLSLAKIPFDKNIILISVNELRELEILRKYNFIDDQLFIYNLIDKDKIELPILSQNIPFYFIVDYNLEIQKFFTPTKSDLSLSKLYLQYVRTLFIY